MSEPDAMMQFVHVDFIDERDLKMLLDKIITLQMHMLKLQQTVIEMRQREIEREFGA